MTRASLAAALAVMVAAGLSCKKNHPPDAPAAPTGPSICFRDTTYTFTTTATDPEGDSVSVYFLWTDSSSSGWVGWFASGDTVALTHAWPDTGTYQVCAKAKDRKELSSGWSSGLMVRVVPHPPPNTPLAPTGPTFCFKDTTYSFAVIATGPDGDSVAVRFDWGDSTLSNWSTWFESGYTVAMSHEWHYSGTYEVRAQALDKEQHMSGWSDALTVQVVYRRPPDTPAAPSGPEVGGRDSSYTFAAVAFHPDSITVAIRFAWGDGDTSSWSAFVASGESVKMSHAWAVRGAYGVTAQAKDTGNALSLWSAPHAITVLPPDTLPPDTLRKWRFRLARGLYLSLFSSPAIGADGTIYIGSSDSSLYAVNPGGTLRWRYLTGGDVRSSPSIAADGTVYVGSYDRYLYAVNPDGTLRWRYLTGGSVRSSPAIATDGTVYVGSYDNYFYAIDPSGTLKWRYLTGDDVYSSPAVGADGTVYVGSHDHYLYAANPDSTLKWRYETGDRVRSSPTIGIDGTVYFGSDDGYIHALNPDGTLKWHYLTGDNVRSSPAITSDGTIYVGSDDNYLYALNPDSTLKWQYQTGNNADVSPAIASDRTVYYASNANSLCALNPDGTLRWRHETAGNVDTSPTIGPDGTVYFASDDGYLYAFRGTGPLASSAWPKFHHDLANTGRVGGGR